MATNFAALYEWLVPGWLSSGDGGRVLLSWCLMLDAQIERLVQGLEARLPSRAADDALTMIGQDRGIQRGRVETSAHYAQRLVAWRHPRGHRVRGSAYALLEQVAEYFGGTLACWTVDRNGTRHDRALDGTVSYSYGETWTWDDGSAAEWSRFWIVLDGSSLFSETPDYGDPALWGGALGTPGYSIGLVGTQFEDIQAMRRLMTGRAWRPAGTQPEWIVVSLDGVEPVPATTWRHWSVAVVGVQTAVRDSNCRYWSLDPEHNNTYSGYVDRWPTSTYLPGGATEAGDPTSFPTSTTLPDGSTYAGDPTSFPTSVRLLDDGDPPA